MTPDDPLAATAGGFSAPARKHPSRLRLGQKLRSGLRVAGWRLTGTVNHVGTRWAARRLIGLLLKHRLFDHAWYRKQRPELAPLGADLLLHYAMIGRHEGLWPNPLFDPVWYAAQNPGTTVSSAVLHYLRRGMKQARAPHPAFDAAFYAAHTPAAAGNPLAYYLAHGTGDPNPAFDAAWYSARHAVGTDNPLLHFLQGPQDRKTNGAWIAGLRARQAQALGRDLPVDRRATGQLTIGIVTFQTPAAMLERAVRSIHVAARHAGIDASILLLDNGGPASRAVSDQPCVHVLPPVGNIGFGAGHNRLMAHAFAAAAGSSHYLALNPDAVLHPSALAALLRMSQAAGGLALIQPQQFPAEFPVAYDPETFDTPWVSGACLLLPAAVHRRLGGFDDAFFMYCEDVDLSWRARAAGLRALTCPDALLFHPLTNRPGGIETDRLFLASVLRLSIKWNAPGLARRVRAELARLGIAEPDLSGIARMPTPGGIADFAHGFTFAPARW